MPAVPTGDVLDFLAQSVNLAGRDVLKGGLKTPSLNTTKNSAPKGDNTKGDTTKGANNTKGAKGDNGQNSSDDQTPQEKIQKFVKKVAPGAKSSALDGAGIGALAAIPGAIAGGGLGAAIGYLAGHVVGSMPFAILGGVPGALIGAPLLTIPGALVGGTVGLLASLLPATLLGAPAGLFIGGPLGFLLGGPAGSLLGSLLVGPAIVAFFGAPLNAIASCIGTKVLGTIGGALAGSLGGAGLFGIPAAILGAIAGSLIGRWFTGHLFGIPAAIAGLIGGGLIGALVGTIPAALLGFLPGSALASLAGGLAGKALGIALLGIPNALLGGVLGAIISGALVLGATLLLGLGRKLLVWLSPVDLALGLPGFILGPIFLPYLRMLATPALIAAGFIGMLVIGIATIWVLYGIAAAITISAGFLTGPLAIVVVPGLALLWLGLGLYPGISTAIGAGVGALVLLGLFLLYLAPSVFLPLLYLFPIGRLVPGTIGLVLVTLALGFGWLGYQAVLVLLSAGSWVVGALVGLFAAASGVIWLAGWIVTLGLIAAVFIPVLGPIVFVANFLFLPVVWLVRKAAFICMVGFGMFAAYNFVWPIAMAILPSYAGVLLIVGGAWGLGVCSPSCLRSPVTR